jgi:zinc protease
LENGLTAIVLERPAAGLQALIFTNRGGASLDPPERPGTASLLAEMLDSGAAGRNAEALAEAAAAAGSELEVGAARDYLFVGMAVLPARWGEAVQLVADVALRPTLLDGELQRVKAERLALLMALGDDPDYQAETHLDRLLFGGHPYGRPSLGTRRGVERIGRTDLQALYRQMVPGESAVVVVGPLPEARVLASLRQAFGGWRPPPPPRPATPPGRTPVPGSADRPRLVLVDRPDAPQAVIRVGEVGVARSHQDRLPLQVANKVLGEAFTSRLNLNLRERMGISYGASSGFAFRREPGPFSVVCSVKADAAGDAIRQIRSELTRLQAEPLPPADLETGKALVAADLLMAMQSVEGLAITLAGIWSQGGAIDEHVHLVERLRGVEATQVQAALGRALHPQRQVLVVVGDARVLRPQLEALGLGQPELARGP